MSFIAYRISDSIILRNKRAYKDSWATERAAKAAITRAAKKGLIKAEDYAVACVERFRAEIDQKKIVKNLISGKEMEISVNTPAYLDPSCESYWSA